MYVKSPLSKRYLIVFPGKPSLQSSLNSLTAWLANPITYTYVSHDSALQGSQKFGTKQLKVLVNPPYIRGKTYVSCANEYASLSSFIGHHRLTSCDIQYLRLQPTHQELPPIAGSLK